jgi:hypothetical protein
MPADEGKMHQQRIEREVQVWMISHRRVAAASQLSPSATTSAMPADKEEVHQQRIEREVQVLMINRCRMAAASHCHLKIPHPQHLQATDRCSSKGATVSGVDEPAAAK